MEIYPAIAPASGAVIVFVLGAKAFHGGPCFNQRAVDGEVFTAHPAFLIGLGHHADEEQMRDIMLEESLLVLAQAGGVEDFLIQIHVQEPAKQEVVANLFDQQPFAANGEQGHQDLALEQPLGRDGGPSQLGIHLVEQGGEIFQDAIDILLDRADGVILGNCHLRRHQADQLRLTAHFATHAAIDGSALLMFNHRDFFSSLLVPRKAVWLTQSMTAFRCFASG